MRWYATTEDDGKCVAGVVRARCDSCFAVTYSDWRRGMGVRATAHPTRVETRDR
jgi:hypothetical protein